MVLEFHRDAKWTTNRTPEDHRASTSTGLLSPTGRSATSPVEKGNSKGGAAVWRYLRVSISNTAGHCLPALNARRFEDETAVITVELPKTKSI